MRHRILFPISVLIALSSCSSPLDSYQRDSDIYRMRHLVNYGELIQEFHAKTGRYPFQGLSDKTIKVSFVTAEQATEEAVFQSDRVLSISQEDFRKEVSAGLNRDVRLWFDPQRAPTSFPLYYLYVLEGDTYFFIVHLGGRYSFAADRGSGFSQIEISNSPPEHKGFWKFGDLIADPEFNNAVSAMPERNEWFEKLDCENR